MPLPWPVQQTAVMLSGATPLVAQDRAHRLGRGAPHLGRVALGEGGPRVERLDRPAGHRQLAPAIVEQGSLGDGAADVDAQIAGGRHRPCPVEETTRWMRRPRVL